MRPRFTEAFPHIPEHCPFRVQTKRNHIILYTFSPSLPAPARSSHPRHHHIYTGRHPIISILTFHMPKPPQSTTPHHHSHALNNHKTVQDLTSLSYLSETHHTSISPSYALPPRLCRFSAFIAHVSVPYVNTLWTQALKIFPPCDRMHHGLSGWAIAP